MCNILCLQFYYNRWRSYGTFLFYSCHIAYGHWGFCYGNITPGSVVVGDCVVVVVGLLDDPPLSVVVGVGHSGHGGHILSGGVVVLSTYSSNISRVFATLDRVNIKRQSAGTVGDSKIIVTMNCCKPYWRIIQARIRSEYQYVSLRSQRRQFLAQRALRYAC